MNNKFHKIVRISLGLVFLTLLSSCDKLEEFGKRRMQEKLSQGQISPAELEKWKDKLALEEAEVKELDAQIRNMVKKTKQAGALSWRIAREYMKAGSFALSAETYQKAIGEQLRSETDTSESKPEIHSFESSLAFFDKALLFKDIDEDLLFETGLAYANASRDRGWNREWRTISVNIFRGLMRKNPEEMRYPYQLALIYFDSSINDGLIEGLDAEGYNETGKALKILNYVLKKQESQNRYADSVPTRFTLANFLFKLGKVEEAEAHYLRIKELLEKFKQEGNIKESLDKNTSYRNVMNNLNNIQKLKENGNEP